MDRDTYARSPVTPEEHVAFLHCWVCRNLLCTPAVQVTREYLQIAVSLASGPLLSLAPCVLDHIYRGLCEMSRFKDNKGGPLWVQQMWLLDSFPELITAAHKS